jgi:hypothetical protein
MGKRGLERRRRRKRREERRKKRGQVVERSSTITRRCRLCKGRAEGGRRHRQTMDWLATCDVRRAQQPARARQTPAAKKRLIIATAITNHPVMMHVAFRPSARMHRRPPLSTSPSTTPRAQHHHHHHHPPLPLPSTTCSPPATLVRAVLPLTAVASAEIPPFALASL